MKTQENSKLSVLNEGSTKFYIYLHDKNSVPSKSMVVFYNKKMEINRDITNLAINAFSKQINQNPLVIVDSMAASGISSIRILKECNNIKKIYINDINPIAVEILNKNLKLNNLDNNHVQIEITQKDANLLLSEIARKSDFQSNCSERKPNIISIDPFGTPNLYIDSAFKAIQGINGLLCITATDTAVLFGIRPKACFRKYCSKSLHTEYCKEIGARILIHFISRIANVNKMGIIPLLTFYSSHFIRIFCITFKDKRRISRYFENYGYIIHCNNCGYRTTIKNTILGIFQECPTCKTKEKIDYAGPLWIGEIHDENFIEELIVLSEQSKFNNNKKINKILSFIKDEIKMPISYYNIHKLCQKYKISAIPKLDRLVRIIKEKGYLSSRTHFDFLSIKTNLNIESIRKCLIDL